MVEGFLAHELTGAGEFVGAEWNKYSNLVGTNMTHATGKTWQNRNRRQTNKRANLVHSISNSGGWSSTGSTRRYQSQTNWYIWNHIQTANLESAEDNFFSVKDGNKRRNLRDKDMSDLAKWSYRKLGLNDDFASSKVFRISMMSLVSQLGEDYARRIGGWSSKACEFYLRVMGENVCAGDLDGVPAAVLARSLPFGPQREFEKMLKNSGDRLAFQRRYNQE
jgi:hypothetical protein